MMVMMVKRVSILIVLVAPGWSAAARDDLLKVSVATDSEYVLPVGPAATRQPMTSSHHIVYIYIYTYKPMSLFI